MINEEPGKQVMWRILWMERSWGPDGSREPGALMEGGSLGPDGRREPGNPQSAQRFPEGQQPPF